jgi:hypothetical protein
MSLLDIRKQFVQLSGRYDLVVDTSAYANATSGIGADFFIRKGQKFIEGKLGINPQLFEFTKALVVGTYQYELRSSADPDTQYQSLKAVKAIYLTTDDNDYKELRKVSIQDWYHLYDSDTANGEPTYYTMGVDSSGSEASGGQSIIKLWAPPDKTYDIKIIGYSGHQKLEGDTDKNYWTLVHGDVLVKAALYELEVFYRNSEGSKDWLVSLQQDINAIDYDAVEQEQSGVSRMRDSWKPRKIGDTL